MQFSYQIVRTVSDMQIFAYLACVGWESACDNVLKRMRGFPSTELSAEFI